MNCPNCGSQMTGGSPHCETIKVQMECHSCGHYENEYYTPDEMKAIELAQEGFHYRAAQRAIEDAGGNLREARRLLQSQASV